MKDLTIYVAGAGHILISGDNDNSCERSKGFLFRTNWGRKPESFIGGVIDTKEAIKLANHILEVCKEKDHLTQE